MLVLAEEPRIDLIIKIAGAHGGDGAHASIIQKDGTGQWMERGAFDDDDAPPHSDEVEVDLSDPDRIVMTTGPGRRSGGRRSRGCVGGGAARFLG